MDLTRFVKAPKDKKTLSWWRRKYYNGIIWLADLYNRAILSRRHRSQSSGLLALDEIRQHVRQPTDISDHLETLFLETLATRPSLIVELGVGPGESTMVFERVAQLNKARLVSVDIRAEMAHASSWREWLFVEADDVEFAERFGTFSQVHDFSPQIDVLFIDTSHRFDHTVREIAAWFPFLSGQAKVFFHDTNVRPIYRRTDGTIGLTYDIQRGVIRALENYFQTSFNEKKDFTRRQNNWLIRHFASCNGLTILEKLP